MPRLKEFDPEQALERAMRVFWSKGYEATSTRDLQKAMGIGHQSMYDTFGDKHSLFLKALDRYGELFNHSPLWAPGASLDAIREHFRMNLESVALQSEIKSCLWANTALELAMVDEAAAEKLSAWRERLERAFHDALANGERSGQLGPRTGPGRDLRALAGFLTANILGIGIMARAGASEKALRGLVRTALSVIS